MPHQLLPRVQAMRDVILPGDPAVLDLTALDRLAGHQLGAVLAARPLPRVQREELGRQVGIVALVRQPRERDHIQVAALSDRGSGVGTARFGVLGWVGWGGEHGEGSLAF